MRHLLQFESVSHDAGAGDETQNQNYRRNHAHSAYEYESHRSGEQRERCQQHKEERGDAAAKFVSEKRQTDVEKSVNDQQIADDEPQQNLQSADDVEISCIAFERLFKFCALRRIARRRSGVTGERLIKIGGAAFAAAPQPLQLGAVAQ